MHAEIAATVAREHTPGLSSAACSHLEEALGRSPTVLELEVYAALLRVRAGDAEAPRLPRLALTAGGAAVLAVARGRDAGVASALELAAGGVRPLAVVRESSAAGDSEAPVERGGSLPVTVIPPQSAVSGLALAVGVLAAPADPPRPPAPGDAVVYLGVPTGREGGLTAGAAYLPPTRASQDRLLELLLALHRQPGLVLAARLLGRGGLAQAASGWGLGVQLQLDAIPRHPPSLHPNELLLAETAPRALLIAPADRLTEVLAAAQSLAVEAATIGQLTADRRLRALLKPPGTGAARLVCELPLDELERDALLARPSDPRARGLQSEPRTPCGHAPPTQLTPPTPPTPLTQPTQSTLGNLDLADAPPVDLRVTLIAPGGQSVVLHDRADIASLRNLSLPSQRATKDSFARLTTNSVPTRGRWRLVVENSGGTLGRLFSWSLRLAGQPVFSNQAKGACQLLVDSVLTVGGQDREDRPVLGHPQVVDQAPFASPATASSSAVMPGSASPARRASNIA